MNLGVFNRVNWKEPDSGGMYSEWASLSSVVVRGGEDSASVLGKFPPGAGKDVAISVVKQLAANLGIAQAAEPSTLTTDREVQWCMEVICYGLSLPLSEHEAIKDCVNVYCEWMTCLHPVPKLSVPRPVCEDPNLYARKMIGHFHNLFVPRKGEVWTFLYLDLSMDTINRQAVLCHRVLRTLQQVAQLSTTMDRQTWETLLLFLLAINDTLLAPPTVKDDVGDKLCERVLSVLFEVWLVACVHCFPSPPLWKTLREMSMNWRHRVALVEQWNRVNLALTQRLLDFMYGPTFPELKILEDDVQLIPPGMSNDCIAQCWFRFLHCIGNPVDLCRPQVISQTQKFLQFAITSDSVVDPCQHPCLSVLPNNFLKAIKGIAGQVDAFLGIASQPIIWDDGGGERGVDRRAGGGDAPSHSPTPPPQRRLAKSFSVAPSAMTKGIPKASLIALTTSRASAVSHPPPPTPGNSGPSSTSSVTSMLSLGCEVRTPLAPCRPKSNSILHLFGEWLFEAAQIGTPLYRNRLGNRDSRPSSVRLDSVGSSSSITRKGSLSATSQPGSLSEDLEVPSCLSIDHYQSGRAEAIGALCRIFCAKKTGEEILSVYYARFYLTLQQGLKVIDYSLPPPSTPGRECEETLSSILVNSPDLLRLDLDGIQILVPSLIDALEIVLPEKDLNLKSSSVSKVELRRNSIHLLLSMLVLPLHYQNLPIKPLLGHESITLTFSQLKPRLMNLLINALQVETDPQNTQMLLGGLLLSVQDSATFEESDKVTQPDVLSASGSDSTSNLLSSDTMSSVSGLSGMSDGTITEEQDGANIYYTDGEHSYVINALNKHSAHGLLVRATYLVCHRLISSWKTDLNVSLAALELLSGLARVHIRDTDALECKRAVKWICDYIVYQCGRPPPAHSKDLHSTIVAAFQCAAVWLVAHPYILHDKDWLQTLFEVVELGISGSKSQGKPGEPIKLKDEKELKPVSMRVRDAAEFLLSVILEQVGYMPSPCGAESLSCLLNEVSLAKQCNSWTAGEDQLTQQAAVAKFRYFVLENSTVLALLEEPLGNDQDPQPTVTVLIRGVFGRHAWTLQLRHLPRHKSGTKYQHTPSPGRPVPMDEINIRPHVKRRYFPESVDRIPHCKVDRSIPELDSLLMDDTSGELTELSRLIERQSVAERDTTADAMRHATIAQHDSDDECTPPPLCHEFQTARLFLSHFGFLSRLDSTQPTSVPPLVALDTSSSSFCSDLAALDSIGSRTCDTCHVFYVRAGQKQADQILSNVISDSTVSPHFLEMLLSLGWPVTIGQHPGWTGQLDTSWKITSNQSVADSEDHSQHGGSLYNGNSHVIYWADVSSEIAFVVPTISSLKKHTEKDFQTEGLRGAWFERSVSVSGDKPRNLSLELDCSKDKWSRRHPPTPVLVVWLESFEDHLHFPLVDMMPYISTGLEPEPQGHLPRSQDCFIIFLHALHSGLLRVRLQGPSGRMSLATPLVDGMVISRRVVGSLVRQTALNMCRRRRLDNDCYQPPHVRRRLKVQEMVSKYRCEMTFPELLTYLLSNEKKNGAKETSSSRK